MIDTATELGQAYVQIMPSAKGINGAIQKELDPESTSAGKSAGNNIVGTIKKAIGAAAIGKALSVALTAGGDLQQSLGGVETLFKDNADKVKKYANEAYKTAGLSANDYMQSVTSFSASLLQSLGGDTEAAAEKANTALIDMSDNANKMGTDMESIQNAYQGFAKQNYTMLDNLKLGYGGTKSEMERLLADAAKLTDVKYDINNLADVYDAIHAVQTELGITGTTALESAQTFSGSLASMKAAFSNFLGNLALGQDVTPSLQALAQTVSTFLFGNFLPMVGNILSALPGAIVTFIKAAIPEVKSALASLLNSLGDNFIDYMDGDGIYSAIVWTLEDGLSAISEKIPSFLEKGSELVTNIVNGILREIPFFVNGLTGVIEVAMNFIGKNLPLFLEKGIEIIKNIANGILKSIPQIIESAGNIINTFIKFIITNLPVILAAGKDLLLSLVDGIIKNLPAIAESAIQAVSNFIDTIVKNYPEYIKTGYQILGELLKGIISRLPDLISTALSLMLKFVEMIISKIPDIFSAGKDIVRGLWDGIESLAGWIKEKVYGFVEGIGSTIKDFFGIHSPSTLMAEYGRYIDKGLAEGIEDSAEAPLSAMASIAQSISDTVKNSISEVDVLAKRIADFDAQKLSSGSEGKGIGSAYKTNRDNFYTANKEEIDEISKRQNVDLGVAQDMYKQNLKDKIPKYAQGTNFHPGGLAWVGELGRELINIPRGTQVIPNNQSEKMMKQGDTIVNVYNPQANPAALARQIKKAQQELALGF